MNVQVRKDLNERLTRRADDIIRTYGEMREDFLRNVVAELKKLEQEQLRDDFVENKIYDTIERWRKRWLDDDRERGFDPRFSVVIDVMGQRVNVVPANMSAQVFLKTIEQ